MWERMSGNIAWWLKLIGYAVALDLIGTALLPSLADAIGWHALARMMAANPLFAFLVVNAGVLPVLGRYLPRQARAASPRESDAPTAYTPFIETDPYGSARMASPQEVHAALNRKTTTPTQKD